MADTPEPPDPALVCDPSPSSPMRSAPGTMGAHRPTAAPSEMVCPQDRAAIATCQRLAGTLFPWDLTRALELALLKTFCVPSISGLLSRSGEF